MKPGVLDIIKTGMALAGPVYSWIAQPSTETKRAMMDAIDAFRESEYQKALAKIRKKHGAP
jgi:hypothetical protein